MFLLEEEEGMRLHDELAANLVVTINYNGMDAQLFQGFTASQTSRTRTNDGHIRTIDLYGLFTLGYLCRCIVALLGDFSHLLDAIHFGDTDALDLSIHQHLTGTALADTTTERTVPTIDTMTMYWEPCLMQGGSNGLPFHSPDCLAFKNKGVFLGMRNLQNRMINDSFHINFS